MPKWIKVSCTRNYARRAPKSINNRHLNYAMYDFSIRRSLNGCSQFLQCKEKEHLAQTVLGGADVYACTTLPISGVGRFDNSFKVRPSYSGQRHPSRDLPMTSQEIIKMYICGLSIFCAIDARY